MTVIESIHDELGASFRTVEGVRVPEDYGRPERTHVAVRNAAGLVEPPLAVLELDRDDAVALEALLTTAVPETDGEAVHGRLVDERVWGEATVLAADERLLCLASPGARERLVDRLPATDRTDAVGVFGVHGPAATEKVAGVLHGATAPERRLSFTRGRMEGAGVTVLRTDDPAGDEGFLVLCAAETAREVHDTLLVRGPNATPFGYRTWATLTLEAGTPLPSDLAGLPRSVLAPATAARVSDPRLVGLALDAPVAGDAVAADAPVRADGRRVGRLARAAATPSVERPVALATVERARLEAELVVDDAPATRVALPFVDGSARSGRILED